MATCLSQEMYLYSDSTEGLHIGAPSPLYLRTKQLGCECQFLHRLNQLDELRGWLADEAHGLIISSPEEPHIDYPLIGG